MQPHKLPQQKQIKLRIFVEELGNSDCSTPICVKIRLALYTPQLSQKIWPPHYASNVKIQNFGQDSHEAFHAFDQEISSKPVIHENLEALKPQRRTALLEYDSLSEAIEMKKKEI